MEADNYGNELTFSLYGGDGLAGRMTSGAGYLAELYDPQGNAVQTVHFHSNGTTATPQVAKTAVYDAFGERGAYANDDTGYLYTGTYNPVAFGGQYGYYKEPYGHYLLGHRFYDAGMGRFVTRDPIGYKGGTNLYALAHYNPVNNSDPNGTDALNSVSNFFAGAGDIISGGYTQKFRQHFGYDDVVDKSSGTYRGGQIAGVGYLAVDTVVGGVGVVNGVRALRAAGGVRGIVAAATIARAKNLGLSYQIRSSGAVHVLEDAKTLGVTETHAGILNVFKRYKGGSVNLIRKEFWRDVLPHQHTYSLGGPPAKMNANWRTTFEKAGAMKTTRIWHP